MSSDVLVTERHDVAIPNVPLGDLISIQSGYAFKSEDYTSSGHFLMRIGNVQDGKVRLDNPKYVTLDRRTRPFELAEGDILTSLTGNIGRVARIENFHLPAALNQRVARLIVKNEGKLDGAYLYYALSTPDFREKLALDGGGAAQQNVSPKAIAGISIPLPPLDEQRRIAEVLRSVDEALHTAHRVADQCEHVLRVELDSIAIRLFAGDAPQVKLGEVARVKGGKRLPKGSEYSDAPTGNPYIRVTDWQDYEIRTADLRYISDDIARSIWRYTIAASDIFISIAGSVGLVASVPDCLDGAYLTENAAKICINNPSALDVTYLLALLRSGPIAEQISKHKGVGGGVPKLALFRIEDLDIPVPDLSIQTEIGQCYRSLRRSVEAARTAVAQLEAARKEVMSDLLSGHVRVPE